MIAEIDGQAAGFKLGYQTTPGEFYSWLGQFYLPFAAKGSPSHAGGAGALGAFARLSTAVGKTRNQFRAMLIMLISHEYQIFTLEKKGEVDEYRLLLKNL